MRKLVPAALVLTAFLLQGCLAAAVVGTAVGVTGAVVGGTAKVAGAGVRAVVPGDSRND
jgi:predicted small secreted protein